MLKPRLRHLCAWMPLRFGYLNVAVTLLQIPALLLGFDWSGKCSPARVGLLASYTLVGFVAIQLPLQVLAMIVARHRWARLSASVPVLFAYVLAVAHRVRTHSPVDWSAITSNADMSAEALGVGLDTLDLRVLVGGIGIFTILILFESCGRPILHPQPVPRWPRMSLCLLVYSGIVLLQLPTFDELSRTLQSAFLRSRSARQNEVALRLDEYPLVHANQVRPVLAARHPDVFLLLVESFRAHHVERKAPNGKVYTPFFNRLIQRGLYVDQFYGNSIQTRKGQFASLCSLIPAISGAEFEKFGKDHLDCLPQILRRQGYQTTFFQAYRKLSYDQTGQFMREQGFSSVESVDSYLRPEDRSFIWGWGLQDDRFYERFFEYFDALDAETLAKPQFVTLAPIGNHMRFNKVPEDRQHIHPAATNIYERYANSLYLADLGLKEFFSQLERRPRFREAVVIVTGDHSVPLGEHGYEMNTDAAYEEFFRIPFLLIWPKVIGPERIRELPYSQLDIAPTILDLTDAVSEQTHFMGVSILAQPRRVRPVPLVQPYSGRYLAVVEYPYKYIYHVRTGGAQLFDLAHDPGELHNLAMRLDLERTRTRMHALLRPTLLVQSALESDRVWPVSNKHTLAQR